MTGYIQDQILSQEEIKEAKELADSLKFNHVYQMYNLFDLERADISDPEQYQFGKTLKEYSKLGHTIGFYFLRYIPGSFTRMHEDNNTDLTIVTLLDDKNLVGGHSLVKDRYIGRERPNNQICSRATHEEKNPPYGQKIIMDVLPMKVGDSLVYGADLSHGVSKVYEGSRLVLVSWYKKDAS